MTQVVAHRGASGVRPENTLPAFSEAIRQGANIIELDVHLSKDQQLIVMHDEDVDRTTEGKGLIREHTLAELKRLNAGSWFSDQYSSTKIPTLQEVVNLLLIRNFRGVLCIEVKTDKYEYPGIEERLAKFMQSQEWTFSYWYCSFNINSLDRLYELDPGAQLDLILGTSEAKVQQAIERGYIEGIHPKLEWAEKNAGKLATFPLAVRPWTVNTMVGIRSCLNLGVTGIITNFPELCFEGINAFRQEKSK